MQAQSPLRILVFNIRHCQGIEGLISHKRVARTITLTGCDAAVLTEVWRVGTWLDQPAILGDLTGMETVFSSVHRSMGRETGNLVMVRGKLLGHDEIDLGGRRERRGCLVTEIEIRDVRLRLAATHLTLHRQTRATQMQRLADELPDDLPLVLGGDFNAGPEELGPLRSRFTFAEKPPATFPAVFPFRALDHVGVSDSLRLLDVTVYPSIASDHLPLLALVGPPEHDVVTNHDEDA